MQRGNMLFSFFLNSFSNLHPSFLRLSSGQVVVDHMVSNTKRNPLGVLPEAILAKIFAFFRYDDRKNIELVSRKWRKISLKSLKLSKKLYINIANYRLWDDSVDYQKLSWWVHHVSDIDSWIRGTSMARLTPTSSEASTAVQAYKCSVLASKRAD